MAYLIFDEHTGSAAAGLRDTAAPERLSPLEWSVVAVARQDRLSTLRDPGPVAIAMGGLFGTRHSPRLACGRLEALRRLAVLVWRRGAAVDAAALDAFVAAGFTPGQGQLVVESIGAARALIARSRRR